MSTRKSIIFQTRLKSPERISYASIFWKCKNDLERNLITLLQIHLYFLMKKMNFENFSKSFKELKEENHCGLLNQMQVLKEKEFTLLTIWVNFEQQSNKLFLNTFLILCWSMVINLISEFTYLLQVGIH